MIWDDPWTILAKQTGGTLLPPPRTPLTTGQRFACVQVSDLHLATWIDLVGTRWSADDLKARLEDAWIPCLFLDGHLVATCVLRPKSNMWILETLKGRKGFGTPLMRAMISWIWDKVAGPFTLGYIWELSMPALISAWWRGWIGDSSTLQYGWVFASEGCNFCPAKWAPIGPRLTLPTLFKSVKGSAVVSDSGLGDGWGYVSVFCGSPDWSAIAKKGGWRFLWMRASTAPKGWSWTGECIVVSFLNYAGQSCEWITSEISFG